MITLTVRLLVTLWKKYKDGLTEWDTPNFEGFMEYLEYNYFELEEK